MLYAQLSLPCAFRLCSLCLRLPPRIRSYLWTWIPRSIFMSQDIGSYDIKKRPVLANRTKYTRCTTYYCILTYEFPLTVENRADLLARGFPGRSDASLGVIFHLHPAPGFHHPRLALAFPQIYCLRHRFFLCVTPLYYKDSAKKCQDFPPVPDKIPGFFSLYPYCPVLCLLFL